ncbi:hypothetical protein [Deinococcus sp.]|uniref:hypothetical protein n=1 Tax=Deinococcus sp. TaxID=47478 RepID=UPI002869D1DD|nr:hypothetical protein [Deinococcus sp.]
MRFLPLVTLGAALLVACAPTAVSPTTTGSTLRAAFSDQGVAFVTAGRACVARAPSFVTICPTLPAAVDVAWNGGDAWAAVPSLGVAVTLDRAARSVTVGRVVALSATRAYREDGSAVNYEGSPVGGVPGRPTLALTGGNGVDYALLAGSLVSVPGGAKLDAPAGDFLVVTPTGARASRVPAVESASGTYQLSGGRLERLDATGRAAASVLHPEGRVGMVGAEVVTVTADGAVRVYSETLATRLH